jgi:hypothetical protein
MAHRLALVTFYFLALAPKTLTTLSAERYHRSSQSTISTYCKLHCHRSMMVFAATQGLLDTCCREVSCSCSGRFVYRRMSWRIARSDLSMFDGFERDESGAPANIRTFAYPPCTYLRTLAPSPRLAKPLRSTSTESCLLGSMEFRALGRSAATDASNVSMHAQYRCRHFKVLSRRAGTHITSTETAITTSIRPYPFICVQ